MHTTCLAAGTWGRCSICCGTMVFLRAAALQLAWFPHQSASQAPELLWPADILISHPACQRSKYLSCQGHVLLSPADLWESHTLFTPTSPTFRHPIAISSAFHPENTQRTCVYTERTLPVSTR